MGEKLSIDKATLERTEKCGLNFACLAKPKETICEISEAVAGEIMFVRKNCNFCNYSVNFGSGVLCQCPARKEIYRKYHI